MQKLKKRIEDIEKTSVGPYMEEIESHFTNDILDAPLPPKLKMPQIKLYGGEGDSTEHLKTYRSWMELQGAFGVAMCRAFSLTCTRAARRWYRKLRLGSISSFT